MTGNRQTLAREIAAQGVALHSGAIARMRLLPAEAGKGIVFRRTDQMGDIPALWSHVSGTELGTVIEEGGARVAVIEHLMAAFAGAEIDDCLVEVDGPELPILDGDSLSYLTLIEQAGILALSAPRKSLRVTREIKIEDGVKSARFLPAGRPEYFCQIDFPGTQIGTQSYECTLTPGSFKREIAPARTFGFKQQAEELRAKGFGRGADLSNTLVLDGGSLMNPDLCRFTDEFARHKVLDAIGDLKLAGYPLLARFEGMRSGHAINNRLLRALFADQSNYELV